MLKKNSNNSYLLRENLNFKALYRKCQKAGNVVISFDDGPSRYTNKILDILKENNVTSTKFRAPLNKIGKGILKPDEMKKKKN